MIKNVTMILRKTSIYGLIFLASFFLDQWIKILVQKNLDIGESLALFPFFSLYHTLNTGVAFSIFAGLHSGFLIFLSFSVSAFVLWVASKTSSSLALTGFALILGGGAGNVSDRIFQGHVVDYFLFHTPFWSFAVFNFADVCITAGAFLILLNEFLEKRKRS